MATSPPSGAAPSAMPSDSNKAFSATSLHVRRAAAGNGDSTGWLVERLTPLLVEQAAYRLGPNLRKLYDPEDLAQDAWLVALPWLVTMPARDGRYTPVLLKFLSTTIRNRIQNLIRKHIVGRPRTGDAGAPAAKDLPAEQTGAVTRAVRRERVQQVRTTIEELPETDREVIVLRGIEQVPNRTAAVLLGISPDAVTMRYRRALAALRQKLPGSVFDELDDAPTEAGA